MAFSIDLSGKVVIVTGVASGLGRGIAITYAQSGAWVIGCDLAAEASDLVADIKAIEGKFHYERCDVTDSEQLSNFVGRAVQKAGRIDVVVSNAGKNVFKGVADCSDEDWAENHNLNLKSHWMMAQIAYPYLKASGGVILVISSNHAFRTMKHIFPYNVAKAALTALVKSLALEWGPEIRSIGIAPGFIDTPGNQAWFNAFPDPALKRQEIIDLHPVKRIGTPDDIGALCVFLSSGYAGFINGTTFLIDGGRDAVLQDS